MQHIAGGAAQPKLGIYKIQSIVVELPERKTQDKVVNILSAYDDLIENNQKQIKLLEEAAQRLYKEWFVDLRFPGYENTPIIDGVPQEELIRVQQELIKKHNELEAMQGRILEMSRLVAMAEAKELLLEDRTRQLEALQEKEEATAQELRELREAKEQELRELREGKEQEIAELREALEQERSKTWLQKLFGK